MLRPYVGPGETVPDDTMDLVTRWREYNAEPGMKPSADRSSAHVDRSNACRWLDLSGGLQQILMNRELAHRLLRLILRRYPLLSGMGTLVQRAPLKWVRFSEKQLSVCLDNGYEILVFPNDFIGKSVYLFGDLDPKITKILRILLSPGDTFVDIGANVGIMVLQCLPLIGMSGRVVAVEPQRVCCEAL